MNFRSIHNELQNSKYKNLIVIFTICIINRKRNQWLARIETNYQY
jgi:hypothetical protein